MNLIISLKKDYTNYWITELFELTGDGQNSYYISLENANTKLTLGSIGNDGWEVYQRTARN